MNRLEPSKQVSFMEVTFPVPPFDARFSIELPKLRRRVGLGGRKMKGPVLGFCLGCCFSSSLHLPSPCVILQDVRCQQSGHRWCLSKALVWLGTQQRKG